MRLDTNQEAATRLLRMEEALARLDETVAGIVESNAKNEVSSTRDRAKLTELSIKVEDIISSFNAFRRDIYYRVEDIIRKARMLNDLVNMVIISLRGPSGEGGEGMRELSEHIRNN